MDQSPCHLIVVVTPTRARRVHTHGLWVRGFVRHPHARAESAVCCRTPSCVTSSPPRARGECEPEQPLPAGARVVVTPTRARRVRSFATPPPLARRHPRARAESARARRYLPSLFLSPPHARGECTKPRRANHFGQVTPTRARRVRRGHECTAYAYRHPHARAESASRLPIRHTSGTSPPRARGVGIVRRAAKS